MEPGGSRVYVHGMGLGDLMLMYGRDMELRGPVCMC